MATYRGLELPDATDPPDGPGAFLKFAQDVAKRLLSGVADLDELITFSATEYEGALILVDEMDVYFAASDGVWKQVGTATFASSAARNTAYAKASAAYRVSGVYALDTSTGIISRYNGSAWKLWTLPETAYTPTLTNVTIGTGGSARNAAKWWIREGVARVTGDFALGTTGSPGIAGPVQVSLPIPGNGMLTGPANAGVGQPLGISKFLDVGAARYPGQIESAAQSTTLVAQLTAINAAGTNALDSQVSSTVPFTWGAGDACTYSFEFIPD